MGLIQMIWIRLAMVHLRIIVIDWGLNFKKVNIVPVCSLDNPLADFGAILDMLASNIIEERAKFHVRMFVMDV